MNDGLTQASLERRLLAFGFDFCMFGILAVSILAPFFDLESGKHLILDNEVMGPAAFFILFIIFCARDLSNGSGPGKRIFNLVVLSENKTPLNYFQHLVRNLGLCIWPIDFAFAFGKNRKRLFEYPVKSRVYSAKNQLINFGQLSIWVFIIVVIIMLGKIGLGYLGIPPK